MASAVLLDSFRARLAAYMAGKGQLKPLAAMAFGDGGHNRDDLTAIQPSESQTALNHEVMRKPLASITNETEFSVTGRGTIESNELQGVQLSEAALLDTDGNLIAIKNFAPKVKELDERYQIEIEARF